MVKFELQLRRCFKRELQDGRILSNECKGNFICFMTDTA